MELKPREYEELVCRLLAEAIGEEFMRQGRAQVYGSRQFVGKSGHSHQIDASAELSFAGCTIRIVVECKRYRRNVEIADLLEFAARVEDIGAHKGIVVTTVGFQDGARAIAEQKGIAL